MQMRLLRGTQIAATVFTPSISMKDSAYALLFQRRGDAAGEEAIPRRLTGARDGQRCHGSCILNLFSDQPARLCQLDCLLAVVSTLSVDRLSRRGGNG